MTAKCCCSGVKKMGMLLALHAVTFCLYLRLWGFMGGKKDISVWSLRGMSLTHESCSCLSASCRYYCQFAPAVVKLSCVQAHHISLCFCEPLHWSILSWASRVFHWLSSALIYSTALREKSSTFTSSFHTSVIIIYEKNENMDQTWSEGMEERQKRDKNNFHYWW